MSGTGLYCDVKREAFIPGKCGVWWFAPDTPDSGTVKTSRLDRCARR